MNYEKHTKIELVQGRHSIEKMAKNDDIFKKIDGRYYVSIRNVEELFQLYEKINKFIGFIHGLVLQKDDNRGYYLFIYDDWIE